MQLHYGFDERHEYLVAHVVRLDCNPQLAGALRLMDLFSVISSRSPRMRPDIRRRGLRFVRAVYVVRLLGLALGIASTIPALRAAGTSGMRLELLVAWCLVWPHCAYLMARFSKHPVESERRSLLVDAAYVGLVATLLHFRIVPVTVILLVTAMNNMAVGGAGLMLRGLLANAFGVALGGVVFGLHFAPIDDSALTINMLPMLVMYTLVVSKFAYDNSSRLVQKSRQLERLSGQDMLTGLLNRSSFIAELDKHIRQMPRDGGVLGVLFIDLDNFKTVNDSLGHKTGDRVLVRLSSRLQRITEDGGLICRYGGDEFVAAIPARSAEMLGAYADRIVADLTRDVSIDGTRLRFGASIGISLSPQHGPDAATLIGHADVAMYHAKSAGKGGRRFFDQQMEDAARLKYRIARRLRTAVQSDLRVHYQPQVDMRTGALVGVEALARWRDSEMGDVSPAVFVPIAEEMGLINELGETVLRTACQQAAQWRRAFGAAVPVSVNVSPSQLQRPEFVERTLALLAESGLSPSDLELEITEGALLDKAGNAHAALARLQRLGLRIAIDDFGTGYSNLSYLHELQVDRLKIDRSFVRDTGSARSGEPLTAAIIAMAQAIHLDVVAEGVETEAQRAFLLSHGCTTAQGWLYGAAVPGEQIDAMLRRAGPQRQIATPAVTTGVVIETPATVALQRNAATAHLD
jgi:diguanylate cyclase (GGDEF)-like protein